MERARACTGNRQGRPCAARLLTRIAALVLIINISVAILTTKVLIL